MLEDKPLKFDCIAQTDLDPQGSHTHHVLALYRGFPQAAMLDPTNHLPFDCIAQTDLDIQGSHMHHVLAPYRGFPQAAMLGGQTT